MTSDPVPWRDAWERALYAEGGFFRTSSPADHFRTSVHIGAFAGAIASSSGAPGTRRRRPRGRRRGAAARACSPSSVSRARRGRGRRRPAPCRSGSAGGPRSPDRIDGLLIANEWLDNIPCDVVELDDEGVVRQVLVDPATGEETLGAPYDSPWLRDWWPLTEPGERAEVGDARDARGPTPSRGSRHGDRDRLRPHRATTGRRSAPCGRTPTGARPMSSPTAAATSPPMSPSTRSPQPPARPVRQREALGALGLDGARPPLELAHSDPSAYVRALATAGEVGELIAAGGLGDFWWIVTGPLGHGTLAP